MSLNWGPHYIVPTEIIEDYSGIVMLRETFDDDLLHKELKGLGVEGHIKDVINP